jgi:tripartite-type tricarboxylate transporter receptor subunit TctC
MGRFPDDPGGRPGPSEDRQRIPGPGATGKDGVNYGSAGAGSPHHLAMELLKVEAGLKLTHAPYRGAAPALGDVAGGQIPVMMVDLAAGAGFIKGGKVRPLAVANATRLPQLPDVPTFAELGLPKVQAAALVGMVAPPDAGPGHRGAEQAGGRRSTSPPSQKLIDFGVEPVGNTPEQPAALLPAKARWHQLIRDLNITGLTLRACLPANLP